MKKYNIILLGGLFFLLLSHTVMGQSVQKSAKINAGASLESLPCEYNAVVSKDVPANLIDGREVEQILTARNTITGAAVYHAGNKVVLNPGFLAKTGSSFLAYNEGCSGNFHDIPPTDNTVDTSVETDNRSIADKTTLADEQSLTKQRLVLYPNPTDKTLSIRLGTGKAYKVNIYDQIGHQLFTNHLTDETGSVEVGHFAEGIYFIQVVNQETGEIGKGKFIIKK